MHQESTERQIFTPTVLDKQDDYLKSGRGVNRERHALQAVENVDFEEKFLSYQEQDGGEKETKESAVWQLSSDEHDAHSWEVNICN